MPKRKQHQIKPSLSTDADLADRVESARRKAQTTHRKADAAHQRSKSAHKQAEAAHEKVHAIELDIRRQAASPLGKPLPPRTGARPPLKSEKQASPALSASTGAAPESKLPFSVVGVGASAGGYEAFAAFLSSLPKNTGMAFVLIQHLDPSHPSHLTDLLAKVASIPVVEIANRMDLSPDHVYVMPSAATVSLEKGRFKLAARLNARGASMPVDIFFRSLAIEQQHRAIGVLLSGTGTDGTLGIQEIKGQGGITFAQDQSSAKHFGMPGSALAAGAIDFVLPPEQIAAGLAGLSGHPYVAPKQSGKPNRRPVPSKAPEPESPFHEGNEQLRTLFMLLRTRSGVDFSLYKLGTLNRRIMRRMVLHKLDSVESYVKLVRESVAEADALFYDLLINVTGFFRDPASFDVLQKKILPRLLRDRPDSAPLRIWTCGCSTGEEAYSIAIAVSEFLDKAGQRIPVQIFASDLNERGLEKARAGVYPENILIDVSPERLRRFFVKVDGVYQVIKSIRDLCIFARQNVVTDPPFSNLDLISCRNVLIYLSPVVQKRVLPVFHYALKAHGVLLLGTSENIPESSDLFQAVDKKNKFYAKKATAWRPSVDLANFAVPAPPPRRPISELLRDPIGEADLREKVDRIILSRYSPGGVLINETMDVLQFRGQTGAFLEHHHGAASLNLMKMVHENLALDLRRAVNKALHTERRVEHRASQIRLRGGPPRDVLIEVDPVGVTAAQRLFLVLFREGPSPPGLLPKGKGKRSAAQAQTEKQVVRNLKGELASTKESLQAIIEEQEATNEELKSANEEIQSSNEELQSTNEELETAREELQSTNEELTTLNQELQARNAELAYLNDDLTNLLNSVHIAVIILGRDLTIRRFTATAEKLFNFIPSDVGRRLGDLTPNVEIPKLEETIEDVVENLTFVEREVQDKEGRSYVLRVRPFRTQERRVDGVVLTLLDIEDIKRVMNQMGSVVRHPLLLLSPDLTVSRANEAFCRMFEVTAEETENKQLYRLGNGQWDIPQLRELLGEILPSQTEVRDFYVEHNFPKIGRRKMMINARRFAGDAPGIQRIAVGFEDITDRE